MQEEVKDSAWSIHMYSEHDEVSSLPSLPDKYDPEPLGRDFFNWPKDEDGQSVVSRMAKESDRETDIDPIDI